MASSTRIETDSFGEIHVPSDRLWGAQTQRSLQNFKIGTSASRMPLQLIHSFGILKKCCAKMNHSQGKLDETLSSAITKAADEVIEGKLDDHFPLVRSATSLQGKFLIIMFSLHATFGCNYQFDLTDPPSYFAGYLSNWIRNSNKHELQ